MPLLFSLLMVIVREIVMPSLLSAMDRSFFLFSVMSAGLISTAASSREGRLTMVPGVSSASADTSGADVGSGFDVSVGLLVGSVVGSADGVTPGSGDTDSDGTSGEAGGVVEGASEDPPVGAGEFTLPGPWEPPVTVTVNAFCNIFPLFPLTF